MNLHELCAYLNEYLNVAECPDYPAAWNGLQVENHGSVTRVAAAVDASLSTIRQAVRRGCDLLIVHHGLFWDGAAPLTGRRFQKCEALIRSNLAVYSAHLPLDIHPEVGNNVRLATAVGLKVQGSFGKYQGMNVGIWGELNLRREALAARLDDLLAVRVHLIPGGPEKIGRVGVITGAGSSHLRDAADIQLDALITGEGPHHSYHDAIEYGVNAYYAGHYATETFGVRALAERIQDKFGLPWEFIDAPTGL